MLHIAKRRRFRTRAREGAGAFAEQDFGESAQEIKQRIYDAAQDLPPGAACAIALIEQRWVLEVKEHLQKQAW